VGDLGQTFMALSIQILVVLAHWASAFSPVISTGRSRLAVSILAMGPGCRSAARTLRLLFQPFSRWYALGYNQYTLWTGTHTPTSSYLIHWGLFLFVIVSWMAWETVIGWPARQSLPCASWSRTGVS
jgi:hypothetical protein